MDTDTQWLNRLEDLARQSREQWIYTYTDFLTDAQRDLLLRHRAPVGEYTLFGGAQEAQRVMARFGNPQDLGYDEPFPIVCLACCPLQEKFADDWTHRDVLGSLMSLGIKREKIGDIVIGPKVAFLFCHRQVAGFIQQELRRIKHTDVRLSVAESLPQELRPQLEELSLACASARIDLLIAKLYGLSRQEAQQAVQSGKVFVDGRECQDGSRLCREGATVSVRGYGKFLFVGLQGLTKKGKQSLLIKRYV